MKTPRLKYGDPVYEVAKDAVHKHFFVGYVGFDFLLVSQVEIPKKDVVSRLSRVTHRWQFLSIKLSDIALTERGAYERFERWMKHEKRLHQDEADWASGKLEVAQNRLKEIRRKK